VQAAALSSPRPTAPRDQQQHGAGQISRVDAPPQPKNGVLLLNLGGPESLADVRPFLYNLFADPDIIRLPSALRFLQPVLANIIATLRSPKSSEGYAAIGGGSPLRRITDEQAAALATALRSRGLDAEVYVAMRYWHPYTEEALQHVVRDGISNLVILPLYPQFSISTSGSSLRLLEHLFKSDPVLQNLKHTVIPSWYQRPGYVGAMVDLIEAELDKFEQPEQVRPAGTDQRGCQGWGLVQVRHGD
jgi:ferrochelatase